jgi:shikimate kinase
MGSGKSTVGRKLANKLNYPFFDTDRLIEERFNLPECEIIQKYGDSLFHQTEVEILREFHSLQDAVVSCGGDLPCYADNMKSINANGTSIYIQMSPKSLAIRLFNARKKRAQIEQHVRDLESLEHFVETQLKSHDRYYAQAHLRIKGEDLQVDRLIQMISDYHQNR